MIAPTVQSLGIDQLPREQSRYQLVVQRLRDAIAQGRLAVGERLPSERELGEQLGVSRTMVREAVKLLSATGLVRTRRGSGLFVAGEPRPFATAAINLSMYWPTSENPSAAARRRASSAVSCDKLMVIDSLGISRTDRSF